MSYSYSLNAQFRHFSRTFKRLFALVCLVTFPLCNASSVYMLMLPGHNGQLYSVHPGGPAGRQLYAALTQLQGQGAQSTGLLVTKNPNGSGVSYRLEATPPANASPFHLSYHHLLLAPGQLPQVTGSFFPDPVTHMFDTSLPHRNPIFPFFSLPVPPPPHSYAHPQQAFSQITAAPSGAVAPLQSPTGTISPVSHLSIVRLLFATADESFCITAQRLFTASSFPTTSDDEIEKSLIDLIRGIPPEQRPGFVTLCAQRLAKLQQVSPAQSRLSESRASVTALEQSPEPGAHGSSVILLEPVAQELPHALSVSPVAAILVTSDAGGEASVASPTPPPSIHSTGALLPVLAAPVIAAEASATQNTVPDTAKEEYNPALGAWNKKPTIATSSSRPPAPSRVTPTPPAQTSTTSSCGKNTTQQQRSSAIPTAPQIPQTQQKQRRHSTTATHHAAEPRHGTQRNATTPVPPLSPANNAASALTPPVVPKSQASAPQAESAGTPAKQRRRQASNDFFLAAAAAPNASVRKETAEPRNASAPHVAPAPTAQEGSVESAVGDTVLPSTQADQTADKEERKERTVTFKEKREQEKRAKQERAEHEQSIQEAITTALAANDIATAREHLRSLPDIQRPVHVECLLAILKALAITTDDTSDPETSVDTFEIASACQALIESPHGEIQRQLSSVDRALLLTYLSRYAPKELQENYMLDAIKLTHNFTQGLVWYIKALLKHREDHENTPCAMKNCIHRRAYCFVRSSFSANSTIILNPIFHSVGWLAGPSGCGRVREIQSEDVISAARSGLTDKQKSFEVFMAMVHKFPGTLQPVETACASAAATPISSPSLKEQAVACAEAIEASLFTRTGSIKAQEQVTAFFGSLQSPQERMLATEYLLKTHPRAASFFITALMEDPSFEPYATRIATIFQPLLSKCIADTEKSGDSESSATKSARTRFVKQLKQLHTRFENLLATSDTPVQEHAVAQLPEGYFKSLFDFFGFLPGIVFTGADAAALRSKFIADTLRKTLEEKIKTDAHIVGFLERLRQQSTHPEHTAIVQALQNYIKTLSPDKQAQWKAKMNVIHFESLNMPGGTPFKTKILPYFEKELRNFIAQHLTDPGSLQDAAGLVTKILRYPSNLGDALDIVLRNADTDEASFYWTSFHVAFAKQQEKDPRVHEAVNVVSRKVLTTIEALLQKYGNSEFFTEFAAHLEATRKIILSTLDDQQPARQAMMLPTPKKEPVSQVAEILNDPTTALALASIVAHRRAAALPTEEEREREMTAIRATLHASVLDIKTETDATAFATAFSKYGPPELKASLQMFLEEQSTLISEPIREHLFAACKPAEQVSGVFSTGGQAAAAEA